MSLPPSYADSSSLPCYSSSLLQGEETVAFTPRGNTRSTVSLNLIKTCSFMTIILKGQNPAEDFPVYGRGSTITGEVELKANASVQSVSVQLKGRLSASISDSGSLTIPVVSERVVLWSQDPARCDLCPSVLPLALTFPQTFTHFELARPIPPTFNEAYYQTPIVTASCSYVLKFTVHNRASKMAFWKPSRSYSFPVEYLPRSRPHRPIAHIDRFLSSLKHVPEDWLQIESVMRTSSVDVKAISCRFFIPSVGAYALSDSIPFHIQLSSTPATLRYLLPESELTDSEPSTVRVYLTRQMMVEVNKKCWRTEILGEGKVRAIAPPADGVFSNDDSEMYVDFEGQVCCHSPKKKVRCGGFNSGTVIVKDFLVFSLQAANPRSSPLINHHYSQPIKLVTDSWIDDSTSHPSDI